MDHWMTKSNLFSIFMIWTVMGLFRMANYLRYLYCDNEKVLKMMVGSNLKDVELQQLVDRTIIQTDKDYDGMISFKEFCDAIKNININDSLKLQLDEQ